jgi:ATP-binding cassette, subfamily B (MDR/TAP), member 1
MDMKEKSDLVVDFRNVTFAYPTRPRQAVLQNLNLQVRRGQKVALVGESGCGKTTVLSLLERFYDIQSGQLFVFDQPLHTLCVGEYRKTVSLVSQEPILYRGIALASHLFYI